MANNKSNAVRKKQQSNNVTQLSDRLRRIRQLRKQIEAGTYNPSSEDVARAFLKRIVS